MYSAGCVSLTTTRTLPLAQVISTRCVSTATSLRTYSNIALVNVTFALSLEQKNFPLIDIGTTSHIVNDEGCIYARSRCRYLLRKRLRMQER